MSVEDVLILIRAARRSRIKARVWAALTVSGIGTAAELAEAANTTIARVHGVMRGDGVWFAHDSSLVALGVAREVMTPRGPGYTLTPAGASAWSAIRNRIGYSDEHIEARWPIEAAHLTVR